MRNSHLKLLTLTLSLLISFQAWATHNRAGEITYKHISGFTYQATITTYTKASSFDADRDSLPIFWGDNTYNIIPRSEETIIASDIKRNKYIALHTFPGPGTYTISMEDENRNAGIVNIEESVAIPFYTESKLIISPQEFGINNSPVLQNPPIDQATINERFIHNPSAHDPDGDSLSYKLIVPKGRNGKAIPTYQYPDEEPDNMDDTIYLDPIRGDFIWTTPKGVGEYNIAIEISEYRNGFLIGSILRDMQILVKSNSNSAPRIENINDTCILAQSLLIDTITATDDDLSQSLTLSAEGGPFDYSENPPTFDEITAFNKPMSQVFSWQTSCSDIRSNFYTFIFKAEDDFYEPLVDIKSWLVEVKGPAPEGLTASPLGSSINLNWNNTIYNCESNEHFKGYTIWRRNGSFLLPTYLDCDLNLEEKGYEIIENRVIGNSYEDQNLIRGKNYCYRITAEFTQGSEDFPYNTTHSVPSNEVCSELKNDIPVMVKADVIETDKTNGKVNVAWIRPNINDLDTTQNPGPYLFELYRNQQKIHSISVNHFAQIDSTHVNYTDSLLNTVDNQYSYYIDFTTNGNNIDKNYPAQTIYLTIGSSDRKLNLEWTADTPWDNDSFYVFRKENIDSTFDTIVKVKTNMFTDSNLINDRDYTYYIQSFARHTGSGSTDMIINKSQVISSSPIDTVPPCPPAITVSNYCSISASTLWESQNYYNRVTWERPHDSCGYDIIYYNIYYSETEGQEMELIHSTLSPESNIYQQDSLMESVAGCYYITSVDSFGRNESLPSDTICVDNCPLFSLPNVFTPNTDGQNEIYHAYKTQRFIEKIELKIFNRWGQKIFETEDPYFEWDGTDIDGNILSEGNFYYFCNIYEKRINGSILNETPLKGWIHLYK